MRRNRALLAMSAISALPLLAAGCTIEPRFERTNPFDSGASIDLLMKGPDSTHSIGERFLMRVEGDPPLPDGKLYITWTASSPLAVATADGEYLVLNATAAYVPVELVARLNSVVVGKTVYVGQRTTSLTLSCAPPGQPYLSCDAQPVAPGAVVTLYMTMTDAGRNPIRSAQTALTRATIVSRDEAVATPVPGVTSGNGARFTAVGTGATWLVVRIDAATDSIRVAVSP